jgi:hypothetical protein
MKKIIALIVLSISTLFVFQSCDGDDTPIEEKKTLIKYCITTDTPDAEFLIYGNGLPAEGFRKKGDFEKEMYTTDFFAYVEVNCKDRKAAIHIDLYVNNKLKASADGNSYVVVNERLKGKGPYLY